MSQPSRTDRLGVFGAPATASARVSRHDGANGPRELLLAALAEPRGLVNLQLAEWDVLLRAARAARALSQLAMRFLRVGTMDDLPVPVRPHIESARLLGERQRVLVDWEIDRIEHALLNIDTPVVLLKGAAYQAAGLSSAVGRLTSDIDILVPRGKLGEVEQALFAAGWQVAAIDPKDEAYFRRWLHELPPLQHRRRRTLLDVHYTILPPTDRLRVNPELLLSASVGLSGRRARVLAPADMFLHGAAHLFRNGHWDQGIRDLVDMDSMILRFGKQEGFWDRLLDRAGELDLRIPCGAALRALKVHIGTPTPAEVSSTMAGWQYPWPLGSVLDRLADRALFPRSLDSPDRACERARTALAYWPVPRLQAMRTSLFWTKRIPSWLRGGADRLDAARAPAGLPEPPNR